MHSPDSNITGATPKINFDQTGGLGKAEWKPEVFKAETGAPDPSLKSKTVRAIAGCLTLGISEGLKKVTGYVLTNSAVIMGIIDKDSRQKYLESFEKDRPDCKSFCTKLEVHTADKVKLDGMLIASSKPSEKYVIWLNGLGGYYEPKLNEAVHYANSAEANVLIFNYRGTDDLKNAASSTKDFVTDTLAMVEYLKEKGVQPENIIIHGFSLGGGIGAQAAAQAGTKHINDRSFSVFSKAVKSFATENLEGKIGKTAANLIGSATGQLIKKLDFELDTRKVMQIDVKDPNSRKLIFSLTH